MGPALAASPGSLPEARGGDGAGQWVPLDGDGPERRTPGGRELAAIAPRHAEDEGVALGFCPT